MGFVITGLAIGITLAFLLAPPLIGFGTSVFGAQGAWRMPFIVLGVAAVVIGVGLHVFFRGQGGEHEFRPAYAAALGRLGIYAAIFLVAVVGIYQRHAAGNWTTAVMLDAGIILVSFMLLLFVREPREEVEAPAPSRTRLGGEPGAP
jgi:ACS family D-galactonate transporter-like MFS transporter